MGFLVGEILLYCLISLLIGGIIGWILKSFVCERDCDAKLSGWESRYSELDGKYKALQTSGRASASASGDAAAAANADLGALRGQIAGLEETNRLQANRIADLEGELNSSVQGVMQGEDLSARLELLEQDLTAARNDNDRLRAQLASAASATASSGESDALKAEVATLTRAKVAADDRAGKLEADLAACKAARSDLEARLAEADRRAREAADSATAAAAGAAGAASRSRKKEVFTTDAPPPANLMTVAPEKPDDLKEIWGVGPVMEGVLNKLGIYTFKQVSELSDRDVEWVSANIGTFPDRIKRDEWVRQAGELHKKHHG